ncbi:unnamed protein product [Somion occarium]|uniref:Uncharacterized protein n=1 Tax=Somion occarium TaxID=3059160 RepID=A0ABP1DUM3_9APHY
MENTLTSGSSSEEPPTKQQKPDGLLEEFNLGLTDAQHAIYDEMACRSDHMPLVDVVEMFAHTPDGPRLLSQAIHAVLSTCPDYMNPSLDMEEVTEWLKESGELRDIVLDAVRTRSFKAIRNLAIFQCKPRRQPFTRSFRTIPLTVDTRPYDIAIQGSWEAPYIGDHHALFVYNLNRAERDRAVRYSNSIAVVQSSGTGKSRMVHEASDLVFTIPCNIRPPADSQQGAYPPSDSEVYHHLVTNWMRTELELELYFRRYFASLFKAVVANLRILISESPVETYEELAMSWRRYLEEDDRKNRDAMYSEVVRAATARHFHKDDDAEKDMYDGLNELLDLIVHLPSTPKYDWVPTGNPMDVKLLLYFDEAHELANKYLINNWGSRISNKSYYEIFLSCINPWLDTSVQVMTVFISTSPEIYLPLKTDEVLYGPSRLARIIHPPITETPFDCSPHLPISMEELGELTLEKASDVAFLVRFGRPLWWSMLESAHSSDKNFMKYSLILLARGKLMYIGAQVKIEQKHTDIRIEYGPRSLAAVVDMLINIDYARSPEVLLREIYQVEKHMRVLYSASGFGKLIETGYSSEPIMAEGAAQQMHLFMTVKGGAKDAMSDILEKDFRLGSGSMIKADRRAEVVVRALVMTAYLRAVAKDAKGREFLFSEGCGVVSFIKELYSKEHAQAILDSTPANGEPGKTFREVFKKSVIRVTHFVRAGDDSAITVPALRAAFIRCMGFICSGTEGSSVDFVLGILLDRDLPISNDNISALMCQVRRLRDRGIFEREIDGFLSSVRKKKGDKIPYVTMVVDLDVRPPKPYPRVAREGRNQAGEEQASSSTSRHAKKTRDKHPRYSIFAYGCSPEVYGVISKEEGQRHSDLLAFKDFLHEHPRPHEKNKEAIRRLRPNDFMEQVSFDWIEGVGEALQVPESESSVGGGESEVERRHFVAVGAAADRAIARSEDNASESTPEGVTEEMKV